MQYPYKISKQYARGTEKPFAAFEELADATAFVEMKIGADTLLNVKITYRIYKDGEVIQEYDPNTAGTSSAQNAASSPSTGASASPSPFSIAPKPAGTPHRWQSSSDEEKKK